MSELIVGDKVIYKNELREIYTISRTIVIFTDGTEAPRGVVEPMSKLLNSDWLKRYIISSGDSE